MRDLKEFIKTRLREILPRQIATCGLRETCGKRILRLINIDFPPGQVLRWRRRFKTQVPEGNLAQAMCGFVDYWSGTAAWSSMDEGARRQLLAAVPKSLARFAPPTLLICGGRSPPPTRWLTLGLARLVEQGEPTIIDSAGHDLPVTHAQELDDRILAHLNALGSGQPRAERARDAFCRSDGYWLLPLGPASRR